MRPLFHVGPRSVGTIVLTRSRTPFDLAGASDLPGTTPMPGGPLGAFLSPDDIRQYQADLAARASAVDNALRSSPKATPRLASWGQTKVLIDEFTSRSPASWSLTTLNKILWRDGQAAEKALIRWEQEAKSYGYTDPFEPERRRPGFDWAKWFPYVLTAGSAILLLATGGYFLRGLPLRTAKLIGIGTNGA